MADVDRDREALQACDAWFDARAPHGPACLEEHNRRCEIGKHLLVECPWCQCGLTKEAH